MASSAQYTLSTTPQLIASGVGEVFINGVNNGTIIYLGDNAVTTTNGFPITIGGQSNAGTIHIHLGSTDELWVVCGSAIVISVLRTR